jgi:hypothetical protein
MNKKDGFFGPSFFYFLQQLFFEHPGHPLQRDEFGELQLPLPQQRLPSRW